MYHDRDWRQSLFKALIHDGAEVQDVDEMLAAIGVRAEKRCRFASSRAMQQRRAHHARTRKGLQQEFRRTGGADHDDSSHSQGGSGGGGKTLPAYAKQRTNVTPRVSQEEKQKALASGSRQWRKCDHCGAVLGIRSNKKSHEATAKCRAARARMVK
jgi:hypothetical protein